jgi:hypothetical protein
MHRQVYKVQRLAYLMFGYADLNILPELNSTVGMLI